MNSSLWEFPGSPVVGTPLQLQEAKVQSLTGDSASCSMSHTHTHTHKQKGMLWTKLTMKEVPLTLSPGRLSGSLG